MSNCVWLDIDEPAQILTTELRRAARPHRCGECDETISPGQLYEYVHGKWEDHWSTHRTCARCVNVRTDYFKTGWIFGSVAHDFEEAFGFDYRKGIPKDFAPCSDGRKAQGDTVPMEGKS